MRIIGLTGGTGSGKSEAARLFAARGIPVIDADAVGHELLAPGGGAVESIVGAFGKAILSEGQIDRAKLGQIVFADADARGRLNAIIHPLIYREMARRCASLAESGHDVVLIDAALLAEGERLDAWLNGLVLVTCPRTERIRRLVQQRGLSPEEAERRVNAQSDPDRKLALAGWVIQNDGTLKMLEQRVAEIARKLENNGEADKEV